MEPPDSLARYTIHFLENVRNTYLVLKLQGKQLFHFMGTSTFSEYTVVADISLAKVQLGTISWRCG